MIKKIHTEDLPDSWELVPLGEFVENDKGKKPKQESKEKSPEFNLPYIDIQAFEEGIIKSWTNGEGCRLCHEDDFLMVWDGSRSGLVGKGVNGALGSTLVRINFPGIFNDYAYYFLQSKFVDINSRAKGVGIPHVDPNLLWNYEFPIPPTNEQKRIVAKIEELFSELDSGIGSLKTAHEQLKVYRQAVLKHAFEGKLTAPWRKRNKEKLEDVLKCLENLKEPQQPRGGRAASESTIEGRAAISVNKPNKTIPEGWVWVPLLKIARQETGHTPSRKFPHYWENGQVQWIGIVDARLHHGKNINETIQKITKDGLDNSSARLLPKGTVCLSRTASVGYVCIMGKEMATSQDFVTWTCSEILDPYFLMYALIAEGDYIRKFGKGTTHTTIYFPEIRAFNISLPPISEQVEIVKRIEQQFTAIEKLETEIEDQLQKSEALRQSILEKAFSGQLVDQNPADEPASLLLERIRSEKATPKPTAKKLKEKRRAA